MIIRTLLAAGEPEHPALICANSMLSYRELATQVDELADQLATFGLKKGDRIAMALLNGLEVVASFLAASTIGTAAPLNPAYTREEFKFYLEDTNARVLITPRGAVEARAAAAETNVSVIDCEVDERGHVRFAEGALPGNAFNGDRAAEEDLALILHT